MAKPLRRKIRNLSQVLKFACMAGMVLFPLLTVLPWTLEGSTIQLLKSKWCLQFSDISTIQINGLSLQEKLTGILIDLIPCFFFVSILFFLIKLLREFEFLRFFSRKNIRYIRWIAGLLFIQAFIYPFQSALRGLIFNSPEHDHVLIAFDPIAFKSFVIACAVVLIAYIMEIAFYLEEELQGTI